MLYMYSGYNYSIAMPGCLLFIEKVSSVVGIDLGVSAISWNIK